ncbi:MAG TPA: hypothetical protein VFD82_21555 [Planctomycetota bacterium]|nr:hypothetical protein [Planctomycetota bacterium]
MTARTPHSSTHSLFDYLIWVPAAFYAVLLAKGLTFAPYQTDPLTLSFAVAIFALVACAHSANARRIRELSATVHQLRGTSTATAAQSVSLPP